MNMFLRICRAAGRGLLALLSLLVWEPVVAIARGASEGAPDLVRQIMPWVIGAAAIWAALVFAPELIHLALLGAIMMYGFRLIARGVFPAKKKRRR